MKKTESNTREILDRAVESLGNRLSKRDANVLLSLQFAEEDHDRMENLVNQSKKRKLTSNEKEELDSYIRVGFLLDALHAKARIQLTKRSVS